MDNFISDEMVDGFLKEIKDEVLKIQYDEIKFKHNNYEYIVYAPIDPPFTTVVSFQARGLITRDVKEGSVLLSTDMEQVNILFHKLREEDKFVVKAFDWVVSKSREHKEDRAYVLCYDFVSHCPYVEITLKDWIKEDED